METIELRTNSDKVTRRKLRLQLNHNKRNLTKIKMTIDRKTIEHKKSHHHEDEAQINTKALLASYYIGCGGYDIGSVSNFLGIPGGLNWERRFTRKLPIAAKAIIDLVDKIVYESLIDEVTLRIRNIAKDIMSDEDIDMNIIFLRQNSIQKWIPT